MHRITSFFGSCMAAAAVALTGCAVAPTRGWADPDRDRAHMMAALSASAAAWNRGDLPGHLAIYDESITAMTKSGPRPTIAAIQASFSSTYFAGGRPKQDLRMEQVAIRWLSDSSALMTGRFVLSGGGLAEQSGWFTLIWLRKGDAWKVVHDHSS